MNKSGYLSAIKSMHEFFNNSTRCLSEQDSGFYPVSGTYTVAQQVAHVAHVIDWFIEGAFRPEGFALDFEEQDKRIRAVKSLEAARDWFGKSVANAVEAINSRSEGEWSEPLPAGPVMGGQPRSVIIGGICDHSAHHRGALTVYARLLGKVPSMPYGG